jgi:hypothetical protein
MPPERGAAHRQYNAIAGSIHTIYSDAMKRTALIALLAGILAVNIEALLASTTPASAWWIGFLVLMPLGLGVLVWQGIRWSGMACVIYGTVGLALDLATAVQILTKDSDVFRQVLSSVVSGLLNFLLTLFGGRSFLDVFRGPQPQGSPPPNPPSPS